MGKIDLELFNDGKLRKYPLSYIEKFLKIFKSPALISCWTWSKPVHLSVSVICLLNFIGTGTTLVSTLATKGLIDSVTNHNGLAKEYALLMAAMVLLSRLVALVRGYLYTKTNARLGREIQFAFLQKTLRKNFRSLSGYHSGDLVNRMTSDVGIIQYGAMSMVPSLVAVSVSLGGASLILVSMDWRFIVLLVIGGILGVILTLVLKEPMKRRHKKAQEQQGRVQAIMQETLANLRLVKASCSEERMEAKVLERQNDYVDAQLEKGYFSVKMNNIMGMTFQLSWLFCMLWGCRDIYFGLLTYGSLAAMIQLVGQVYGSISGAADLAGQAYGMISSAERLREIMDLPQEEREAIDVAALYKDLERITFADMSFAYDRDQVLGDVNFSIYPGESLAVIGESGGGKSTLFQLLMGIYQPNIGKVNFVFKKESMEAGVKTRQLFAYVPQGNILFSGTLRENIAMFTDQASDEDILQAAKIACIDQLIESLPEGLETLLGERGVGLSEGQAQRIAVARAVLSEAPILLLDESTSALDEMTEARMLENISNLKNKTCLIVTHRKAALSICKRRILVEDGRVKEDN